MKINDAFITHDDEGQKLLVSSGASKFSGLVRSNETAGFIISCLEKDTTEAEIVAAMQKKYSGPKEAMERDVKKLSHSLGKSELLMINTAKAYVIPGNHVLTRLQKRSIKKDCTVYNCTVFFCLIQNEIGQLVFSVTLANIING